MNHILKIGNLEQEEGMIINKYIDSKEMRKNGVGKNNWGTYEDDMKDYGVNDNLSEDIYNDEMEQNSMKFRAVN